MILLHVIAGALATHLNVAAALPSQPIQVPENWSAAQLPDQKAIERAVRATLADQASSADPAPEPAGTLSGANRDKFAEAFADAKVPGCLRPDGLKRQSTLIFNGFAALPFILVAAVRGKCN
jgi:hypothetical protein